MKGSPERRIRIFLVETKESRESPRSVEDERHPEFCGFRRSAKPEGNLAPGTGSLLNKCLILCSCEAIRIRSYANFVDGVIEWASYFVVNFI